MPVAMWIVSLFLFASSNEAFGVEDVLANLQPQHPRLYLDEAGFEALKVRVETLEPYRQWYAILQRDAEAMLDTEPVVHRLIGIRLLDQSRRALTRIGLLAALYRLDGDPRKVERAKQEMLAAAAFPDWNPKHFLDTAEMTHALAIGYDWLYHELSAEERAVIRGAIVEKGLREGLKYYAGQEGWPQRNNNWNQVCNSGMTLGALAIADEEPELAREIIEHGRESIVRSMRSYAPDGGFPEGPVYWDYGTRYNVFYLSALESAIGTDFGLAEMPGFSETGDYRIHIIGPTHRTFNYGDASDRLGTAPHMLWLARKFRRPEYTAQELMLIDRHPNIFHLIWSSDEYPGESRLLPPSALFRGIDVAILRSGWDKSDIFIGFKGGDNRVSHSHLDLGSFVLDWQGVRWAVDLGGDHYDLPGYFGSQRWSIFRLRNQSHNTLTVEGHNQDPQGKAPLVAFRANADRAFAVVHLTDSYRQHVDRWQRGIALLDGNQVLVQDEIAADDPVTVIWNMYTPARIALDGSRAELTVGNQKLYAQILSPSDAEFSVAPADAPPPQARQPDIRSLRVETSLGGMRQRLAVLLAPTVNAGEGIELEPLEKWIAEAPIQ